MGLGFDSRIFVTARVRTNIQFNGREYANADEMPPAIRDAYDRAVDDTPDLHSGARLAAKLKAKIIVNGTEFNHAGEMSVDDRHLYHEALEAVFPRDIAVPAGEGGGNQSQEPVPEDGWRRIRRSCLRIASRLLRLNR